MESGAVARVRAIWAALFKLPPDLLDQPGTTLIAADGRALDAWITPWPVGERVVIEVPPTLLDEARALLAARPAGHRLTAADFKEAWGADNLVSGAMRILVQDGSVFRPAVPEARYHARQLTAADQPAFDAFLARCPADEVEEGEVAMEHEVAYGLFDGARMVAGASTYIWRGLVDIGVLTDLDYRRRGLGKAVVSAICAHYTGDPRVLCYRHDLRNVASQGVADSLGFVHYATVEGVRRRT